MNRARVLLADDHTILLEGLKGILKEEFDLVGTARNGRALISMARKLKPDVVVADISMPILNGIEAAIRIRETHPEIRILFLTMHEDVEYAHRAMQAGALGYVMKNSAAAELVRAIRDVLAGRVFVSPSIAEKLKTPQPRTGAGSDPFGDLSSRQRELLQLLAEGLSAKEIADVMCLSARTVEYHKYNIMKKFLIRTNAQLIQFALKSRLASE
ncbi:MAG: response regulator transcription factor [Proteobacteria bacterium]|nr:response regulator transcription factor [Pseudomonadota bacterium]